MTQARAVRLSAKGQLVIPKDMRDALGVKEGDELLIAVEGGRVVLSRAAQHARTTRGLLKGTWGKSARDVARYLEGERRSWR
jgi:AbrB family looped-hinge helix DNA binding protein